MLLWGSAVIFLTVGSQMPFDRLVRAVDAWAGADAVNQEVVAQIGDSELQPRHMRHCRVMEPKVFRKTCEDAEFIVGHAGMGTVLTALDLCKPLLILPRRGDLQETRNDHQLATARSLASRLGVWVAWDDTDLIRLLEHLAVMTNRPVPKTAQADPRLLAGLREFIRRC